jgi:hypothetical protein
MNPVDENMPISDDDCFDLLVDGELSEEKRRELLSRLDDEPTGWRRCALAFLQAQSWREACGKVASPDVHQPGSPEPADSPRSGLYMVEFPGGPGPGGQPQTIRLPAVERDRISPDWLESLPAPISDDLLELLQRGGMRVEQRRGVLPLKTEDGRILLVPVDDVDIYYEGRPTF